jgi:hypothetical protein
MALHRDIYWVGRQWAVTGIGIQACDQKRKSTFDIEAKRLWEDGVLENARTLEWLNLEDFEQAVSVARKYYPEPPKTTPPPDVTVSRSKDGGPKDIGAKDNAKDGVPVELAKASPMPPVRKFELRIEGLQGKLIPVWRIRNHQKNQ